MKYLVLALILFSMACGKGGSGGGGASGTIPVAPGNPAGPGQQAKNNYRIVITGDPTMQTWFNSNTFDVDVGYPDHYQTLIECNTCASVNIPAGGTFEFDLPAYNLQNLVIQNDNYAPYFNPGPKVCYRYDLYRNGVIVETYSACSSVSGSYDVFGNW